MVSVLVVAYVFLMLLLSSASELVSEGSNKIMVNRSNCIEAERNALLEIKRGLVDTYGKLSSWTKEENCCQWSGVECDRHTGHVTHLHLSHLTYEIYSLYASYPQSNFSSALLHLRNLQYLDLSYNMFSLRIPSFIGSLTNLLHLDLSHAEFYGEIPVELGNLSKLNYLDLGSNLLSNSNDELCNLSSPIPKLIASLTSLIYLDLSHNGFGDIPNELGNLSKLHHFDLSYNDNKPLGSDSIAVLFHLSSLKYLDLSGTYIGTANVYNWASFIHKLPSLSVLRLIDCNLNSTQAPSSSITNSSAPISVLNLSENQFDLSIFDRISNLSASLVELDLSYNRLKGNIPRSFGNMPVVTTLDLSYNQLKGNIPKSFGNMHVVTTLDLSNNNLSSTIFDWVSNMSTTLLNLDLSNNLLQGQIPDTFSMGRLINLDLSNNLLQGPIPNSFGVLTALTHLHLSANQLEGVLPKSFHNLSSLQFVDLSGNNLSGNLQDLLYLLPDATLQNLWISENHLTGSLPDITRFSSLKELKVDSNQLNGYLPKSFEHKSVLKSLDLSNNSLQGSLPSFTRFSFIEDLHLNDNKFSGSVPDFTGCWSLKNLLLGTNQLTVWETKSVGQLTNLYRLDLSRNSINGTINEYHLSKLYSLKLMDASFNSLTFNMSSEWLPPFNLEELSLASCKVGPNFPIWIRNQSKILNLDFSSTQISDTIPIWFWSITTLMQKLDLSSNKIRGTFSYMETSNMKDIDLSSNHFEGPLPLIPSTCSRINLSQNKFSGKIDVSQNVFGGNSLNFLDLSSNLLIGEVPDIWNYFENLVFVDLGNNNFSGRITMSFNLEFPSLRTLILRNNSFYGELPESLRNCTQLGFVDFGLNSLSGTVPAWIGQDLSQLYALILKSNKFYGNMPYDLCHLSNLRFLDLSMNKISGHVPECLSNLTAMTKNGTGITEYYYSPNAYACGYSGQCGQRLVQLSDSYVDDASAGWKGKEQVYGRNFAYLKMIDISSNEFAGEFPNGITRLLDLNGLNLSRNKFYGQVPEQIGGLHKLENLDLSNNNFSCEIPLGMSGLTFLSYLDLSSNDFSGRIPLGSQLQLFNSSMYEGNAGLCGVPLPKKCPGDETSIEVQPSSNRNEVDEDEIFYERWLYISIALGFSSSFWGICVTLLLNRRRRHAYFLFLTNLKDRLYVFMAVRNPF